MAAILNSQPILRLPTTTTYKRNKVVNTARSVHHTNFVTRQFFSSVSTKAMHQVLNDIQRRGFRSSRLHKEVQSKMLRNFFAALGIKTKQDANEALTKPSVFREKMKGIPENERKFYMEGYINALEYANEQKNKRLSLRTFLLSAFLLFSTSYILLQTFVALQPPGEETLSFTDLLLRTFGVSHNPFFSSTIEEIDPSTIDLTFRDVRGADEAKAELSEVVKFLQDPSPFQEVGAHLPRGVLLVGPPGTGKTLLAKAVAGEAQVPFFHASGSEFDEMFVGQGARRVRDLFAQAKEKAPSIIFIDEIDSVGAKRTSDTYHPHANQTVNQLLSEMDGFKSSDRVVVLGATNRINDLDSALLRPGRFDVHVHVPVPDLETRKDLISFYLRSVAHDPEIDVDMLARQTTGFTGADIENMINQASIRAASNGFPFITLLQMEEAKDRVVMGPARIKGRLQDEETNLITAYHEAGHTVVSLFTKEARPVQKVTIIPRGVSLGHTSMVASKDEYQLSKAQVMAQLDVMMGGRVAEELMLGPNKVTTGAADDLRKATELASRIVKTYGFSEKVGLRVSDGEQLSPAASQLSQHTADLIDKEINRFLNESYNRAKEILTKHKKEHTLLAEALMEHETLTREEVYEIVDKGRLGKPLSSARKERLKARRHLGLDKHDPNVLVVTVIDDENKEPISV